MSDKTSDDIKEVSLSKDSADKIGEIRDRLIIWEGHDKGYTGPVLLAITTAMVKIKDEDIDNVDEYTASSMKWKAGEMIPTRLREIISEIYPTHPTNRVIRYLMNKGSEILYDEYFSAGNINWEKLHKDSQKAV